MQDISANFVVSHTFISSLPGTYSFLVVKTDVEPEIRKYIAGRVQASQAAVDQQQLWERAQHLQEDLEKRQPPNFKESCAVMYAKGGFIASKESPVCFVSFLYKVINFELPDVSTCTVIRCRIQWQRTGVRCAASYSPLARMGWRL